ncbi:energy-coupling factor transporter transmembrane component T family protein [Thermofilum pendens]|uniref:Cobalt transport protein n=1 Tax=Thermofilum pendens (strain DSM 2475 / Hrk 5) TaxID=368408 RepID=A1RW96_THEPD|nr:energy-coupling factor transporter transmembrane component T [Thermofilum pendens]ABL77476.1 cobalt transport protein [Thermofilum pendens Hrk 5]
MARLPSPKDFLSSLNPLTKLALFLVGIFQVALLGDPKYALLHLLLSSTLLALVRPKVGKAEFAAALSTLVGYTWVNTALYIYNYSMSPWDAARNALQLTARVAIIILYSMTFVATTTPKALTVALTEQLGVPYVYAFMSFVTLRMAPLIRRDLENMIAYRRIKGYFSWKAPHRYVASYAFPLLFLAVRRSITLALSMQARGFGKYAERTNLEKTRFRRGDLLFALAYLSAAAAPALLP